DLLDDLARRHGLYLTDQLSARFSDLTQIPATMDRVRATAPATLAGSEVVEPGHPNEPGDGPDGLPPTAGPRPVAAGGTRVSIPPSGTEPKVKCYLEVIVPVEAEAPFETVTQAREAARARLDAVREDVAAALGL